MKYRLHRYPGYPGPLTDEFQPDLRPYKRRKYKLNGNYSITVVDEKGEVSYITVPDGFISDGASVPRLTWTLSGLTPDGLIRGGALVHDLMYRRNGNISKDLHISRKDCDKIFYDLMRAAVLSRYRSYIAYRAVRLFARRF